MTVVHGPDGWPIGTMPPGTAVTPAMLTHPHQAMPWCLEKIVDGERAHVCWRRKGHSGRHAEILGRGSLWAVWGDDVHQAARERGRARRSVTVSIPSIAREPGAYVWTLPEVVEPPC